MHGCVVFWLLMATGLAYPSQVLMAQTKETTAARWLERAEMAPPFTVPDNKFAWEAKRQELRAQLWKLLGKLPERPKHVSVETISSEERDGYRFEKFRFDNGAGSMVPGYIFLPKERPGKAPGILYCHWHAESTTSAKRSYFKIVIHPKRPARRWRSAAT